MLVPSTVTNEENWLQENQAGEALKAEYKCTKAKGGPHGSPRLWKSLKLDMAVFLDECVPEGLVANVGQESLHLTTELAS